MLKKTDNLYEGYILPSGYMIFGIPNEICGIYRMYSKEGTLLYVGSSSNIKKRINSHRKKEWFLEVKSIAVEKINIDYLQKERNAIQDENPRNNIQYSNYNFAFKTGGCMII